MLQNSCLRFAERSAYSSMGAQISYAELELERESRAFSELEYWLLDSGAVAIVVLENFA